MTRLPWRQSLDIIRGVHDLGVNWFDTAQGYLDAELRLGEAMQGFRDKVAIVSKSGAKDAETLVAHVEASLKRLRTDYLDVFLFHGGAAVATEDFERADGILDRAKRLVDEGKVRHLGFSAHRPEIACRALDFEELEVAMVPANYISREYIDGEFMPLARRRSVGVVAMKPYGGGRITAVAPSLRFLKTYPDLIPCIGVDSVEQMAENISIWEQNTPYSEKDEAILSELRALLGDRFCRLCRYCLPCPEDIPIPTVNFLKVFSMQMPFDRVVNEKHTEAVEKADTCTECRTCVERCPYDLDIPALLRENSSFYREFAKRA